jgi:hypothetical protein
MDDKRVNNQERQLMALPSDFRKLATWAWTELRPTLEKHALEQHMDPVLAKQLAARLSRLVASQMYGDITRARVVKRI